MERSGGCLLYTSGAEGAHEAHELPHALLGRSQRLAVDGEVLEEGGGAAFAGTVNGNEVTDGATELHKGDVVQLDDGAEDRKSTRLNSSHRL